MPLKTCPGCKNECGPRTLKCKECGHEFLSTTVSNTPKTKRRYRQLCGIGAWINDTPKNMPVVEEPGPLSEQSSELDIATVSHYIAYEGIGFCILDYISPDRIEDKRLASLWADAKNKLIEIINYVGRKEIESTDTQED